MGRLIVVLLLLGAAYLLLRTLQSRGGATTAWPVFARPVLTDPEQVLYRRLVEALPGHVVLAQVVLSSFIRPKKGTDFNRIFNGYSRMSADFIICGSDLRVLAVIELDDKTHERADRQAADAKKTAILEAAGIPLHRCSVKALPGVAELRRLVIPAIAA